MLAVVVGALLDDEADVSALDEPLMTVVDGLVAPMADDLRVDFLTLGTPVSTPVLFAAGGYCGVAPGMVVDSVVVDCACEPAHHMAAAIMALTAKRVLRFFMGSLHPSRFELEAERIALRPPGTRILIPRLADAQCNNTLNGPFPAMLGNTQTARRIAANMAPPFFAERLMDGLEAFFLLCTVVWLFVDYF